MPHTPGPWRVQKDGVFPYVEADQGKNWNNPTVCHFYEEVTPVDNADANAHLIAAAPDLLAALEALIERDSSIYLAIASGEPVADILKQTKCAVTAARAVITKVKGDN